MDEFDEELNQLVTALGGNDATRVLDLVASTEAYESLHWEAISLEALDSDTPILTRLIQWLKVVAETLFGDMARQEIGLRALQESIAITREYTRRGSETPTTVAVNRNVRNLCINSVPITTVSKLLQALDYQDHVLNKYFTGNDLLLKQGNVLDSLLKTQQGCGRVHEEILKFHPSNWLNKPIFNRLTYDHYGSEVFMGNQYIGFNSASTSDRIVGSEVRLLDTRASTPVPESFKFTVADTKSIYAVLDQLEGTVKYMLGVNTLSSRNQRKAMLERLSHTLQQLEKQKLDGINVEDIGRQVRVFMDWFVNPYAELYSLASRNLRASLMICKLCLK